MFVVVSKFISMECVVESIASGVAVVTVISSDGVFTVIVATVCRGLVVTVNLNKTYFHEV